MSTGLSKDRTLGLCCDLVWGEPCCQAFYHVVSLYWVSAVKSEVANMATLPLRPWLGMHFPLIKVCERHTLARI